MGARTRWLDQLIEALDNAGLPGEFEKAREMFRSQANPIGVRIDFIDVDPQFRASFALALVDMWGLPGPSDGKTVGWDFEGGCTFDLRSPATFFRALEGRP